MSARDTLAPAEMDSSVRAMHDAETDAARAEVLVSAPVTVLLRWRKVFDEACRHAAFDEGRDYLRALAETLEKPRHRGQFAGTRLDAANTCLLGVIERGRG